MSQKVRTFAPVLKMVVIHSVRANGNRSLGKNAKVSLFYGQPDAHRCMPSAPVITAAIQKDFGALRGTAIFRTTGCAAVPLSNRLLGVDRVMKQEQEIWKDIEGYEGKYQVSNLGRVKSLSRIINGKRHKTHYITPVHSRNYRLARLFDNGKVKLVGIHRLVAMAFVDGYKPGLVVNHKDENPLNNTPDNLEWVTPYYNQMYGTAMERSAIKRRKPVLKINADGEVVGTYKSITDAARDMGVTEQAITSCCHGRNRWAKGFHFAFSKEKSSIETVSQPKVRYRKVDNLPGEEWRDVVGYEGLYMVSNMGRVKIVGKLRKGEKIKRQSKISGRYYYTCLSKNGFHHTIAVHRLVAMAFCDGYQPGLHVNHIDENSLNNHADNLEWVTGEYNRSYGHIREKWSASRCKPVIQMTLDGEFVREWPSIKEAAAVIGKTGSAISGCCYRKSKSAGGYKWKFKNNKQKK